MFPSTFRYLVAILGHCEYVLVQLPFCVSVIVSWGGIYRPVNESEQF